MEVDVTHVVRLYTLLLLRNGPHHGYELIQEIGEITGDEPSASHIYPFLQTLEENDLVEPVDEGSRGKTVYQLTDEGEEFMADQISSLGSLLSAAIEGSIEECSHCECQIYEGSYEEGGKAYCCKYCAEADTAE